MNGYEAPSIQDVGTVRDLTQGDAWEPGQDYLSWIPIIGDIFGS